MSGNTLSKALSDINSERELLKQLLINYIEASDKPSSENRDLYLITKAEQIKNSMAKIDKFFATIDVLVKETDIQKTNLKDAQFLIACLKAKEAYTIDLFPEHLINPEADKVLKIKTFIYERYTQLNTTEVPGHYKFLAEMRKLETKLNPKPEATVTTKKDLAHTKKDTALPLPPQKSSAAPITHGLTAATKAAPSALESLGREVVALKNLTSTVNVDVDTLDSKMKNIDALFKKVGSNLLLSGIQKKYDSILCDICDNLTARITKLKGQKNQAEFDDMNRIVFIVIGAIENQQKLIGDAYKTSEPLGSKLGDVIGKLKEVKPAATTSKKL